MDDTQQRFDLDSFIPKGNRLAGLLDALYEARNTQSLPNECEYLIPLLDTFMYAHVALIESFAYDRAYRRAESDLERSTCLSLFDIVVGEGMTYLCGYSDQSKKGTKYAKIKQFMPDGEYKKKLLELCDEFTTSVKELDLLDDLKESKDITKHYDSDYLKIADHLKNIHSDKRYKRNITFLSLLPEIIDCISDYLNQEQIIVPIDDGSESANEPRKLVFETMLLENPSIAECISEQIYIDETGMMGLFKMNEMYRRTLEFERCGMFSEGQINRMKSPIQDFMHLTTPIWHAQKVRLDIHYAIKAYFAATEHLERQANVYRMLMALYGGYTKLYGNDESNRQTSLLEQLHKPISDCRDNSLSAAERSVKRKLHAFEATVVGKYEYIRNCMTHNKENKKDKILDKYYFLCTLSPKEVVTDCYNFLDITRPLTRISDAIMKYHYPNEWGAFNNQ